MLSLLSLNQISFSLTENELLFVRLNLSNTASEARMDAETKGPPTKVTSNPITNVITGVQQIDLDSNDNLVYSGFKKRGWDLYIMNNSNTVSEKEIKNIELNNNDISKYNQLLKLYDRADVIVDDF